MDPARATPLQAVRDMLGLSLSDIWLDYFGLGGNLSLGDIGAALDGRIDLSDHEHDVLVQALNEYFLERSENHPLRYADELPPPD